MTDPRKTPLFDAHQRRGARMVPFAGFEMPIQYDGILAEHARCRTAVGLFDVSHMGEIRIHGPRALEVLNGLVTNDIHRVENGRAMYTAMCAEDGTIVDDLIVYRLDDENLFLCVNAANRATDFAFIKAHAGEGAEITDEGDDWAQIAVQGPRAPELLARMFPEVFPSLGPFRVRRARYEGAEVLLATTGYTGEPGAEIYLPNQVADALWEYLMDTGKDLGVGPVGLGARDTLRLEMGYCLYGQDIDRTTTPLEAGLGWVTRLDKANFVGQAALSRQKECGVTRRLVGVTMIEKGIPRTGYPIIHDAQPVGAITSGTRSPSTGASIGLGYVPVALAQPGTEIQVDCRGKVRRGRVVKPPFYTRP